MDKLGIEKAWIAGHSMGGYVLAETVRMYESRFFGAMMLHSTTYADSPEKRENREREISLIDHNKLQSVVRASIPNMFAPQNRPAMEEKILEITEISEVHDPAGIKASLKGMMERRDNTDAMAASRLPKLFLFGNQDHFIPVDTANNLVKKIPGCEVHFIEGCGHNSFLEKPQESATIIREFISKNSQ
jgi:pimeloyl-ACP methyl ester carboxylesterase